MEQLNIGIVLYIAAAVLFYFWLIVTAQPDPTSEEWTPSRLQVAG
jgi:hypothetical protein